MLNRSPRRDHCFRHRADSGLHVSRVRPCLDGQPSGRPNRQEPGAADAQPAQTPGCAGHHHGLRRSALVGPSRCRSIPANLRNGRRGMTVVAVVGPLTNLAHRRRAAALAFASPVCWDSPFLNYVLATSVWLNCRAAVLQSDPRSATGWLSGVAWDFCRRTPRSSFSRIAQVGPMLLFGLIMVGQVRPRR